jgi:hypothetical protein
MLMYVNFFNKGNSFFQDLKLSVDPNHYNASKWIYLKAPSLTSTKINQNMVKKMDKTLWFDVKKLGNNSF